MVRERSQVGINRQGPKVPKTGGGAEDLVVAKLHCNGCRAKGVHSQRRLDTETGKEVSIEPTQLKTKPFKGISKKMVWLAYKEVRKNRGAGGADGVSLKKFEEDLENNLYKIWNQMSSGSYFPPPVKAISIPKKNGGERLLGVPTVGDRVAQTVVKQFIEPKLDPLFHPNSYGYRPNKSALDAVGTVRQRCWKYSWVLEFDIKGLFDNIPWDLLNKAVQHHITEKWVLLYIDRWLKAPMELEGKDQPRTKGTPQGSVVSPVLSNLFLHYAFDRWMSEVYPNCPIVRYADDGIVHCCTKKEAIHVKKALVKRFKSLGLEIHPGKTHIIYCQQASRPRKKGERVSFDFLGYTFKPRKVKTENNKITTGYLPAVSRSAKKAMNEKVRKEGVRLKSHRSIVKTAQYWNPILRGWINYYGKYYPSALYITLHRFNGALIKWISRTLKSLKRSFHKAYKWLKQYARAHKKIFVHWQLVPP